MRTATPAGPWWSSTATRRCRCATCRCSRASPTSRPDGEHVGVDPDLGVPHAGRRHGQRVGRLRHVGGRPGSQRRDGEAQRRPADRRRPAGDQLLQLRASPTPGPTSRPAAPNNANNFGVDIARVVANGVLPNRATSTRSADDEPGVLLPGHRHDADRPVHAGVQPVSKTVTNLANRSPAQMGDTLEYQVSFTNTGADFADNSVVNDVLAAEPDVRAGLDHRDRQRGQREQRQQDRRGRRRHRRVHRRDRDGAHAGRHRRHGDGRAARSRPTTPSPSSSG